MIALEALLAALPRLTLVVGKGGVGKTTCAAGIAAHLAATGERTLLLSTDPADTLADAVGAPLDTEPRELPGSPGLVARRLSASDERAAFLARWRDVIVEIIDRGTYLDLDDVGPLVDAALPGADEIFAVLALARAIEDDAIQRLVVDTAPTGHTLRLLALPRTFEALVALLDAMQEKHRFMVRSLTHRYRADRADAFLQEMQGTVRRLRSMLTDRREAAALLVTRAETVVVAETVRYADALRESGVAIAAVIVNAVPDETADVREVRGAIAALAEIRGAPLHLELPRTTPPTGLGGARALVERLRSSDDLPSARAAAAALDDRPTRREGAPRELRLAAPALSTLVHRLTIVGGKGGVGKTTVSCALAIAAADAGARTLLVSTDPAPSIADALAQPVDDEERPVQDVPRLVARQMDADAAFARFRGTYEARVDALFDALVGRGMDVAYDRAILRDLLALAPPGIDELYALSTLGETLAEEHSRHDRVIVDPAPTGHLLRLLEIPGLALQWTHQLMRLMLKYREVAGLGDAAGELLGFAKRTRALDALLHDPAQGVLVITAIDEPLVRGETARLVREVRARGVAVRALVWNRVDAAVAPLPTDPPLSQLVARDSVPAPVGVPAIRAWSQRWSSLEPRHG